MFLMRRFIAGLLMMVCMVQPGLAQTIPDDKLAAIEQLITISNSIALAKQMSTLFSAEFAKSIKIARPNVPQKALDALPEVVGAVMQENIASMKQIFVTIYDKYYSLDDIQQLTQFYQSPLGQKLLAVQPQLAQDSVQAGARWGQMLQPEIQRRIKERLAKEGVNL
jgi:uncharacterized protein